MAPDLTHIATRGTFAGSIYNLYAPDNPNDPGTPGDPSDVALPGNPGRRPVRRQPGPVPLQHDSPAGLAPQPAAA